MHPRFFITVFLLIAFTCASLNSVVAQDADNETDSERRTLFAEDKKGVKAAKSKEIESAMGSAVAPENEVNVAAPEVEYLKESNEVRGKGGVIVSGKGSQIQADEATYNSKEETVTAQGNVIVTTEEGVTTADSSTFHLETETGTFSKGAFTLEDGGYKLFGEKVEKISEFEYDLEDADFTTCHCPDESKPWNIESGSCHITQEGHAHTYGSVLKIHDVPIFYTPYLFFPVKMKRASGLLAPEYGTSDKDGFQYKQPLFLAISDHADITFTPFLESQSRNGTYMDYRHSFSRESDLKFHLLYSNERPRSDGLRGTDITGVFDPQIDSDRVGVSLFQKWSSDDDASIPSSLVSDLAFVSDNLLLREIDKNGIDNKEARNLTSKVLLRNSFGDYVNSELGTQFTQALLEDQDLIFQRLPELEMKAQKSLRPFGYNPFGFKVVPSLTLLGTGFERDFGYDGQRYDLNPSVTVPLRYENYFNSSFVAEIHNTHYNLDNTIIPGNDGTFLEPNSSDSRTIPMFKYNLGTGVERVFEIDPDGGLASLLTMGAGNQSLELKRIRHTIEPTVGYTYIPEEAQDDLPFFDSLDRISEKSLVLYGATTRFYGRFLPKGGVSESEIEELAPRAEALPALTQRSLLDELGGPSVMPEIGGASALRKGEAREVMNFSLLEGYDQKYRPDPEADAGDFTDTYALMNLYPTKAFGYGMGATFDRDENQVTSWGAGTKFHSDRGDMLRARYNYIRGGISQLEFGTEVVLSDRLRAGYFTRFDDFTSEFLENIAAIRILSACNCWHFDLGYSESTNPDREKVLATFTFSGLGDLSQEIPYLIDKDEQNQ